MEEEGAFEIYSPNKERQRLVHGSNFWCPISNGPTTAYPTRQEKHPEDWLISATVLRILGDLI